MTFYLLMFKKQVNGTLNLKLWASLYTAGIQVWCPSNMSLLFKRHVFFWSLSRWIVFRLNQRFETCISLKVLRDWSLESIKACSYTTLSWLIHILSGHKRWKLAFTRNHCTVCSVSTWWGDLLQGVKRITLALETGNLSNLYCTYPLFCCKLILKYYVNV